MGWVHNADICTLVNRKKMDSDLFQSGEPSEVMH